MKRIIAILLSVAMLAALAACGTKNYQVTTKTGKTFTTQGAPEYDLKSETYKFKNEEGREVILNQEDVDVIQEQGK
jgi:Flp pilus assembly protein TadD